MWRRLRRGLTLALVLAVTLVVVPQSSVRQTDVALVRVRTAQAVDHPRDVVWILCLGSDARPGQRLTGTRADAIQLVGLNLRTGAGTAIGVPRDSYVDIRGHGRNKINASMFFGGPQLMADSVGRLVGVRPDYVFTTGFLGFRGMVRSINGVTVFSKFAFRDPIRPQGYHRGKNNLNPFQALIFGRVRHPLPRGDFDRSANQQELLRAILRKVRAHQRQPGYMERGVMAAVKYMNTDLKPSELYRLAQGAAQVKPWRFKGCVVQGPTGNAGGASVVFPNVGQARRLGNDARKDATLDHGC
ncbi:MAG: LCP family protein [Nocardioidaceae bacterium]|nr:LCP family protein [Nocardioidaceae bacterium]NUS51754.1 LCP family protein [Nocardioidaceae bacterium]